MIGSSAGEPASLNNMILSALPAATLGRLKPHLQPVSLPRNAPVNVDHGNITDVYFVDRGTIAIVKTMRDGKTAQVRTIGIEGLTDPWALFGVGGARLDGIVQIPGEAFQIKRRILTDEMKRDTRLSEVLRAYTRFSVGELTRNSACNCLHSLDSRCCRLLLISQDNALADSFDLTQEHLASMLGVQRSGVTIAAGNLKSAGLIDYKHGRITILDRAGLEEKACECYVEMRWEMEQFLSGIR